MDATRRTLRLRRVAMMASLAALLLPAGQAEVAHHHHKLRVPVITRVRPMSLQVGQTLTGHGHNFRKGEHRNSVAFRSAGAPAVFVRSGVSTTRMLRVKVPAKLVKYMANKGTTRLATRFHLRVLAARFSRHF